MKNTVKTKLQAPWYTYRNKLAAMFERDPDIKVLEIAENSDDRADYIVEIEVLDHGKFTALEKVLPRVKEFGGVKLGIILYDEKNGNYGEEMRVLYETLFEGNPIVDEICTETDFTGTEHTFICFKPEVIQFFADDTSDKNGNWSGLAQNIAREIFEGGFGGIHFCTAEAGKDED